MARSPVARGSSAPDDYLRAFGELAQRIRDGQSFSGRERNCVFLNTRGPRFADVSAVTGLDFDDDARGLAVSDLDGDGDADLVVNNRTAPLVRVWRNDTPPASAGHITIRLVGVNCIRDAIGARVEVRADGRRLVQSLVAGDGFLSQSGKALLFGLGTAESVDGVRVHWPGGEEEVFDGVGRNGSWVLTQGTGRARAFAAPPMPPAIASPTVVPASTEEARILLSQPLPVPPSLSYRDFDGRSIPLADAWRDAPVLVNLWATWCAPCAAELKDFAALKGRLTVLPLSIEALATDPPVPSAAAVRSFLRERGLGMDGGWATGELVEAFDQLVRDAVYRHRRLPLPASFLITKEGRLAVIYKGRTTAAEVLRDVASLDAGPDHALRAAVPFPGVWARSTAFATHPVAVARAYLDSREPDEAIAYLKSWMGSQPAPASDRSRRQFADILAVLAESMRPADPIAAEAQARDALRHLPGHIPAAFELALALAAQHKTAEAQTVLQPLTATGPARLDALDLAADIALAAGRPAEAAARWRAALALNPRFIPALHKLSNLLATATDASARQPAEAKRLADFLLSAPHARQNPNFLAAAAAAHAATGRFDDAVTLQTKALRYFGGAGDSAAVAEHSRRLHNYRKNQPAASQ